jgi:hypothetical protein
MNLSLTQLHVQQHSIGQCCLMSVRGDLRASALTAVILALREARKPNRKEQHRVHEKILAFIS